MNNNPYDINGDGDEFELYEIYEAGFADAKNKQKDLQYIKQTKNQIGADAIKYMTKGKMNMDTFTVGSIRTYANQLETGKHD